ncbi:hypothetical protein NS376_08350 [Pseudomonas oryzihabitans]|nr:hypothetical protein NS376_08350 [Pseudomonas psychrotolerans]KTT66624.1 hypothetical protein NS383_04740 [Pseudomonas psychrotolerans]
MARAAWFMCSSWYTGCPFSAANQASRPGRRRAGDSRAAPLRPAVGAWRRSLQDRSHSQFGQVRCHTAIYT